MHRLADVGVNAAPFLHGGDDGAKAIVGEHHIGGAFGNLGAALAHCAANIGGLERGRIVHAVAGHGYHLAALLQGPHDAHLMFRRHARINGAMGRTAAQFFIRHGVQLRAGEHRIVRR